LAAFRYAWRERTPLLLVSLVALASLFGLPYLVMMPVFARDVLHVGAQGLGYLFAAAGVGALAGGLNLARLTPPHRRGPLVATGATVFFAAILGFSLSKSFALSCVLLLCTGWAMVSVVATVNTLLQTLAPNEVRGRVLSMHTMAFFGFTPFGSLLVGALADKLGAPIAMAASSGLALIVTIGLLFAAPRLLKLQ
jgi:MFS family permease